MSGGSLAEYVATHPEYGYELIHSGYLSRLLWKLPPVQSEREMLAVLALLDGKESTYTHACRLLGVIDLTNAFTCTRELGKRLALERFRQIRRRNRVALWARAGPYRLRGAWMNGFAMESLTQDDLFRLPLIGFEARSILHGIRGRTFVAEALLGKNWWLDLVLLCSSTPLSYAHLCRIDPRVFGRHQDLYSSFNRLFADTTRAKGRTPTLQEFAWSLLQSQPSAFAEFAKSLTAIEDRRAVFQVEFCCRVLAYLPEASYNQLKAVLPKRESLS